MSVATTAFAAGSVVVVRDEEWIVSSCEAAGDGWKIRCVGSSELVQSTPATFYSTLDDVEALDPAEARLVQTFGAVRRGWAQVGDVRAGWSSGRRVPVAAPRA